MKIKEYVILRGKRKPFLKEKNILEWEGDFLNYKNIVRFLNECLYMNQLDEEYVYILAFDFKMNILGFFQLSHGNSKESYIGMREIGMFLLLIGAEQFIVAHNHPNGSSEISISDLNVTNSLQDMSCLIDIELIQHFVIGYDSYNTMIAVYEEDDEEDDEE